MSKSDSFIRCKIFFAAAGLTTLLGGCRLGGFMVLNTHSPQEASSAGPSVSNPLLKPDNITRSCSSTYTPGHTQMHRLTPIEYNNTVRDLLHDTLQPANSFPPEVPDPSGSGYTNESAVQAMDYDHALNYFNAAQALASEVIMSKGVAGGPYDSIVTCKPATSTNCAQSVIQSLATGAFRRPITNAEIAALMGIYSVSSDFDKGLNDVIIALLMDPSFLFIPFTNAQSQVPTATYALNSYQLASRLSYFLWQSMPDAELMIAAQRGTLGQADVLQTQVQRMLKDPKGASFLLMLRNEWAGLGTLSLAANTLPGLDDATRMSMIGEVDAFLQDLVNNNRSFLTVVNANYTFVNKAMADYYGVPFMGADPASYVQVPSSTTGRMGIVLSAAVQTATAGAVNFTHPVKRGRWTTNRITCQTPPPPPKDIPMLDPMPTAGLSPREKLNAHVKMGDRCLSCHLNMDTYGLGLENYDTFGKWRTAYPGVAGTIDASGKLADGTTFTQPSQMYAAIAAESGTKACLATHITSIALTRALTSPDDKCAASAIGQLALTENSTFMDLITKVVTSKMFMLQNGESP